MGRVSTSVAHHRLPLHRRISFDPRSQRRWALVLVVAIATAALVAQVVIRAEQTRNRWGHRQAVLVISEPLATGQPVGAALRVEHWPAGLVPTGAFDQLDSVPDGATAVGPLASGVPLTDMAVTGSPDVASRPRVAVPAGLAVLPLSTGDTVEVWATVVGSGAATEPTTRQVTTGADVVAADEETVVLSVDAEDIGEVAEAAALATVTLVATG